MVVVQRSHAEMIAGAKEFVVSGIIDGERKVAEQSIDAFVAPLEIGAQDEFGISERVSSLTQSQRCQQ